MPEILHPYGYSSPVLKKHTDDGRAHTILDYFDLISIIHLKERTDRYEPLVKELQRIGISVDHPKVRISSAPIPNDASGFASRAVYGNFLSHLDIIRDAHSDRLDSVLILEDDAIFARKMTRRQATLISEMDRLKWGMCHFGHSGARDVANSPSGLVSHRGPFGWTHCYAVHKRAIERLLAFLERTLTNDPENPEGARMSTDGAFNHFRALNPDIQVLVANPVICSQRGSRSSIGRQNWYDGVGALKMPIAALRSIRDEAWRYIGWPNVSCSS